MPVPFVASMTWLPVQQSTKPLTKRSTRTATTTRNNTTEPTRLNWRCTQKVPYIYSAGPLISHMTVDNKIHLNLLMVWFYCTLYRPRILITCYLLLVSTFLVQISYNLSICIKCNCWTLGFAFDLYHVSAPLTRNGSWNLLNYTFTILDQTAPPTYKSELSIRDARQQHI